MIAKLEQDNIIKGSFEGVFYYHEVRKADTSEIVFTNIGTDISYKDRAEYYNMIADGNSRTTNDGLDVPFSFHPQDEIDDNTFLKIWEEWREGMGIAENRPITIYRHYDQDHQHYHVVISNVDENGKPLAFFNTKYKKDTIALCRRLEKKYGLTSGTSRNQEQRSYQEDLAKRYAVANAMFKADKAGKLGSLTAEFFAVFPRSSKMPDEKKIRESLGRGWYKNAYQQLESNGFIYKTKKARLIELLDEYRNQALSRAEFEQLVRKDPELYIRRFGKARNHYYKYGLKKESFNIKENKLPKRFSHSSLSRISDQKEYSAIAQREYIGRSIEKSLRSTSSFEEFIDHLASSYQVEIKEHKNSKGIYGLEYLSSKLKDGISFKGSEIRIFKGNRKASYGGITGYFDFKRGSGYTQEDINVVRHIIVDQLQSHSGKSKFYQNLSNHGITISRQEGKQGFYFRSGKKHHFIPSEKIMGPGNTIAKLDLLHSVEHQENSANVSSGNLFDTDEIILFVNHLIENQIYFDDSMGIPAKRKRKQKKRKNQDNDLNIG